MSNEEKTYRSYGVTKLDDNYRISLNIKWLVQICIAISGLVYGYLQITNRITDLERRVELADTNIEELVEKHIEEEQAKIAKMEQEIEWYSKELNLNPLSWGKKKRKK
tara:strand:+ start:336 stop:659 length:324 start_codon:yes stop_codon:yes gene_type:complete